MTETGAQQVDRIDAVQAARMVEGVVGNAWATDPAGNFTYVTPAALEALDITIEELNSVLDAGNFGWRRVIHPEDYEEAASAWRRCLLSGEHYDVEHRMLRPSGAYGWSRSSGQALRDNDGLICGWYGTVIDADVRSVLSKRLSDPAFAEEDTRMAADKPRLLDLIHPDDRTAAAHAAARAFWTGVPQVTRYRQRQPNGTYRWTETRSEPGYSVSVDIDDLVTDKEPAAASPSNDILPEAIRSARVVESIFGNGWAFDAEGRWIYLHPFAQSSLGVTLDYLNGSLDEGHTAWKRLLHPDDYGRVAAVWRHCLATGDHFNVEFRFRRASGAYVWARTAARPATDSQGRIVGWFGIALDIDVYKKTVSALRDRERELSQLVDMVPSHIWRLAPDGEPTFFNKRMADFLGMDVVDTDKPGMTRLEAMIHASVHPEDARAFSETIQRCLKSGQSFSMRYRLRRHDGAYHWMSSKADPMLGEAGQIVQWYGVCVDVHDMVLAEEALQERERLLWQLVETLPAMIDCAAPDGEPVYRSQQLREFLGYELEELDGMGKPRLAGTLESGVHPDDLTGVKQMYANSLATGEPYARRHRLRRFDGEYRWVETRAAPMRNAEGAIVQWNVICLDIDGEVRAQAELRLERERLARASQAASLAELSASIAHEVNQPLAAIVANSHACHRWLSMSPPNLERAKETAEFIIHDANSAADVVNRIRALFRQSADMRQPISLGALILEVRNLLADEAIHGGVRLSVNVQKGLPPVALDQVQMQQVLINLMRNGIEAMATVPGERILQVRARQTGDVIQTEISDSGPGVEAPDRIFEPFYTTKQHGMGMGLAICRSIVESHGGSLRVENNDPVGATLVFTLPIGTKAAQ